MRNSFLSIGLMIIGSLCYGMQDDITIGQLDPDRWQEYQALVKESYEKEPQALGGVASEADDTPESYWRSVLQDAQNPQKRLLFFAFANSKPIGMAGAAREEG